MTAHIVNKKLDTAILSKKTMINYLRSSLGFEGVIFFDDMLIKVISGHFGFEKHI